MRTSTSQTRRIGAGLLATVLPLTTLIALQLAGPAAAEEPLDSPTPTVTPIPVATVGSTPTPVVDSTPEPTVAALPTAALTGLGLVLAPIAEPGAEASYLPPGAPLEGVAPFQVLRVNALVGNHGDLAAVWTPQVEFRGPGQAEFQPVPTEVTPGVPLHTTHEWVTVSGGTEPGPETTTLTTGHQPTPQGLTQVQGRRAGGPNPDVTQVVEPGSATEQEFTVKLGLEAEFGATYELRITNAGEPLAGLEPVQVVLAAEPTVELEAPEAQTRVARLALAAQAEATTTSTIHQPFSPGGGSCATCHSTHRAQSSSLVLADSQTAQCATCHGAAGLGGPADIAAEFAGATPNDLGTRSFYSHELTANGHTTAKAEVAAGALSTRHAQCSDCHNPHDVTRAPAAYDAATGTWGKAGSTGTVGVLATFGAAGTAPTLTPLGEDDAKVTAEQQVCYTCHSPFATQLENDPARPSRDRTDVAKAFNPANTSYHPVEAPGRNQSRKMADSLSGYSPYRLWTLQTTDTIRCTMCHTSGSTPAGTDPAASLPVHASANRGILVRPYENRQLPPRGEYRRTANFALCLTCHAQAPYTSVSGAGATTATNFGWHGMHIAGMALTGSGGTDIDVAGAGQGNALCAECHFRSHSTTDAVPGQAVSGEGIVNFAPNVVGSRLATNKTPTFVKMSTGGNCTLTCHGKDHQGTQYVNR